MSSVYWLVSYPKSGNTWLRALLTNYRRTEGAPASINELDGWHAAGRELFDDYVGIESNGLTREQIEYYRPRVLERLADEVGYPIFLKIHDAFTYNANGEPIFPNGATGGVIYIVRNPLDVAVSYAHHINDSIDEAIRAMSLDTTALAELERPDLQLRQPLRSWSGHVRSWLDAPGLRLLLLRYEDLLHDTRAALTRVIEFIGFTLDNAQVARAVEFSQFDSLRAQEADVGFAERQPTASSFFRAGRAGSWRDQLSPGQVERLIADHGHVMRELEYLSPAGDPLY